MTQQTLCEQCKISGPCQREYLSGTPPCAFLRSHPAPSPERRGCLTCYDTDCPVWQTADQNCWKSQEAHDAAIAAQAQQDVLDAAKSLPFHCYADPKSDIGDGMSRFIRLSDLEEHLRAASTGDDER